jgi:hypothetical protein
MLIILVNFYKKRLKLIREEIDIKILTNLERKVKKKKEKEMKKELQKRMHQQVVLFMKDG